MFVSDYNAPQAEPKVRVNAGQLWAGGFATGIVAALVAIVGILICRGPLDVQVLAPKGHGTWGDASTAVYAVIAFAAALVATGLIQLLYTFTPQPGALFAWIVGLLTVLAVVVPFAAAAKLQDQVATAVINALIGLSIYTLTASIAAHSRVVRRDPAYPGPTYPGSTYPGQY
jgi:hypothetical protein